MIYQIIKEKGILCLLSPSYNRISGMVQVYIYFPKSLLSYFFVIHITHTCRWDYFWDSDDFNFYILLLLCLKNFNLIVPTCNRITFIFFIFNLVEQLCFCFLVLKFAIIIWVWLKGAQSFFVTCFGRLCEIRGTSEISYLLPI